MVRGTSIINEILGIHALGWSRKQAIEYMVKNTAMNRQAIEMEVDRCIFENN